jgi:hypothetical protein
LGFLNRSAEALRHARLFLKMELCGDGWLATMAYSAFFHTPPVHLTFTSFEQEQILEAWLGTK